MINSRDRRNGLILSSNPTYGKYNNKRKAKYNLSDIVLNLDSESNISSDTIKFSDDEFGSGPVQPYSADSDIDVDEEGDSFHGPSDVPYSQSQLVNISIYDNENYSDNTMMIASPDKDSKTKQQQKQTPRKEQSQGHTTPSKRSILQDLSPLIQNNVQNNVQNNLLANGINDKRIPLNSNTAPTFQRNSSAGLSHLRKRSSITSNSSKRWSMLSFNNEDKENSSISNISKRFSINSIPSIHSVHSTSNSSSKTKRFSITSQQSSSNSSMGSFKTALNKVGNILSSVSVNSLDNSNNSNESTPYKNIQPGVVGEPSSNKRSSENANLTPIALRQQQHPMVKNPKTQPDDGRRNPRSQTEQLSQSRNPNRYLKVDDDTISLISTNTTSSLRSSRSRFRLSSIFSSSYKKENDAESIRSLKGKCSFNDIRRSVLRLNKKESISDLNRNMISLPIPDNDSRLKLSNRLRNSSSIISINSVMSRQPTIATMNTTLNTTTSTMNDYNNVQLEKLIKLTGKDQFYTFSDYINKVLNLTSNEVLIKFNEASYSEVFQVKNFKTGKIEKILKIIPFGDDSIDQPSVDNVLQELTINLRICNYPGFIKINDSMVVEGSYPNFLLKLWDDFNELKGSKNSRPDEFNTNQKYLILDLEYGGLDLERFKLNKSGEGLEIFWQIVQILSTAEKNLNFEHRDLHWGNIVIDRIEDEMDEIDADLSNISIDEDSTTKFTKSKLSVKLIDYTLSRLNEGDTVIFTGLDHPDFFKGKGDYQFDIYRFMRNEIQSRCEKQIDWSIFTPRTNLYWLHYVLLKIINGKSIKKRSKDHSFRKLEYLAKCLDPRRKRVNSDVSSRPNFKNGGSKWLNYYSTDFRNCSDVLKLGEVCKLF